MVCLRLRRISRLVFTSGAAWRKRSPKLGPLGEWGGGGGACGRLPFIDSPILSIQAGSASLSPFAFSRSLVHSCIYSVNYSVVCIFACV